MLFFNPSRRGVALAGPALASSLALLAACAPDLGPAPQMKIASGYAATRALGAPDAVAWPGQDWWKAYDDPQLDALIDEALKGSPDLKVAEARLREAGARSEQAGAALLPSLSASGSIQETGVELNLKGLPDNVRHALPTTIQPITQLGGRLQYQLDFFGKNRAAVAAASSQRRAAQFELDAARLQISTAVATAYADLVRLTADRQAAVDAVRVRGDTLTLVSDRVRNGLESRGQSFQSSAEANVSLGDLAAIDADIDTVRHQLAALVGAGPDRGLDVAPNLASVSKPWGLPSNLPADLIGRRPDVAAARLRALAAADQIKVAYAGFYPNFSLTGQVLDLSLTPDQIFTHNADVGQIGPAVSLPLFQGGQLQGAYRGARANYDEAVATYDKTVVDALHEVADAVSAQKALAGQLGFARKAAADSQKAYDLALMRYKGGLSPYLVVLTAESTLIQQQRAVADLQARALSANVALVRALGGGFADNEQSQNAKASSHG